MFLLAFAEQVQLVPDGTMFIHIAIILLMIFILNRTFFRPINRILESRERNKVGGSESQSLLSEVAEKEAKYTEAIREARSKGYGLIEQERAEALSIRQERVSAAQDEAHRTLTEEKQTTEARAAIAAEAENLAEKISSNILRA
jgi:F-type H+-transporting ATPase subunit b